MQTSKFRNRMLFCLAMSMMLSAVAVMAVDHGYAAALSPSVGGASHLARAKVFLAASDYRRALDACLAEVKDHPSVESYVYLTYVYQAVDGYLEHLAKTDQWVKVNHVFLNLATATPSDLVDPPDVLTRIAKEIIQQAAQQQADVAAAMANRLNRPVVDRLWQEQTMWRSAHPEDWWAGVPPEWSWK